MSILVENESELDQKLSKCPRQFVLFYASWCGFSKEFLPVYEKYSKGRENEFCRVLTDRTPACERKYAIDVVPTVIYFENGRPAKRLDSIPGGGLEERQLSKLISSCAK